MLLQRDWKTIKRDLLLFLKNEVKKRGFQRVVFGLSGGLDSAVVAYLCREAFGEYAKAILMPSSKSSKTNFDDAKGIVEALQIPCECVYLDPYEKTFGTYKEMNKERYGNFCARIRMMILYDIAYRDKALVIGTSNKSERMLGYGTIFGDLACAINPIGDLFKTEIFSFAEFLGIAKKIIQKKPSADLYEGQSDEKELGFSYREIDFFLNKIIQMDLDLDNPNLIFDMMKGEYCESFLKNLLNRIYKNRFKTQQPKIFILNNKLRRERV